MLIGQFNLELRIGQGFEDDAFNLNNVFLRQANTSLWRTQSLYVFPLLLFRGVRGVQQPSQLMVCRKIFRLDLHIGFFQMLGIFPFWPFQRADFSICNPDGSILHLHRQIKPLSVPAGNRFYDTAFFDLHVPTPFKASSKPPVPAR